MLELIKDVFCVIGAFCALNVLFEWLASKIQDNEK
jgi:hypothetical protein